MLPIPLLVISISLSQVALDGVPVPPQLAAKLDFDRDLKDDIATARDACGSAIALTTNFDELDLDQWTGEDIPSRCKAVVNALTDACKDPARAKALSAAPKEVRCLFGGKAGTATDATKANMSYAGGVFTYRMHPSHPNLDAAARDTLDEAASAAKTTPPATETKKKTSRKGR